MSIAISLIIINFNREEYLERTISSVLSQTRKDFELLIWDDGSSDRSVDIARGYADRDSRVRVIAAQHQGIAQARKDAIANTRGKYLGWVDSDDWLEDTALEATSKVLDSSSVVGMVYTDYYDVNSRGKIIGKGKRCDIPYSPQRLLVDFMTFHFRLIRREVYDRIGGIDPNYEFVYDYDLCLRISEITTVQKIDRPLYYYRYHQQSRSAKHQQDRIRWSQKAIASALQRRGLAESWQIEVSGDRFSLQKKERVASAKQSPLSNLRQKTKALLAVLPFTLALGIAPAQAQQIVPNNDGTMTVITEDGNSFNIDGGTLSQDGKNLFHSFQEFGLDAGQIANFLSNPNIQNILGRINGGNPSVINGLIQVTGGNSNLYLMNPSGIVFGDNASLNVPGDFTATTATGIGIGDGFFNAVGSNDYLNLVGNPNSFNFENAEPGTIINAGNLEIAEGQNISLTGGKVINTGTINAPGGNITVAAVPGTNRIRISQAGQILNLEVAVPTNESGEQLPVKVTDLPSLLRGLPVEVDTGVEVAANDDVTVADSEAVIPNTDGTTIVSGELDASDTTGGEVNVLGDKVGLIDGNIDVSGTTGGGTVLVGGDYKGEGELPTAEVTFIDSDSFINADALETGDGGTVIAWSDASTRIEGNISATGGETSGNGGFVETSSAGFLDIQNTPDVSASNGQGGTWLIDPHNIFITDLDEFDQNIGDENPFIATGDNVNLWVGYIEQALGDGSNVTVSTGTTGTQEGNITLQADLDFDGTGNSTLTFEAANNIFLGEGGEGGEGDIFDSVPDPSDALNLIVTANSDDEGFGHVQINNPIDTGGGDLEITGVGNFADGITIDTDIETAINSEGGNITLNGIATTGAGYGGINIQDNLNSSGGNVTLNGTGSSGTGVIIDTNVNAGGGDINVTGTSDGNDGVFIRGQVATSGAGNINVTGTSTEEIGIKTLGSEIEIDSDTQITTAQGSINLSGTSTNNIGVNTQNTEITSTDGAIAINGTSTNNDPALIDNTDINTDNNLTITVDDIDLSDTTTLTANDVTLQPETPGLNIAIAPVEDLPGSFNLTQAELDNIAESDNIIIGRDNSSGTITVANDIEIINNLTLRSPEANGAIAIDGQVLTNGNDFTLNAGTNININRDITTNGGVIAITSGGTINSTGDLDSSSSAEIEDSVENNGGNITVTAENDITLAAVDSSSDNNGGTVDITSNSGAIDIVSPEGIFSSATAGNGGNVTLRAAQDINLIGIVSGSAEGNGGNITLASQQGQINATKPIPNDDEDEDNPNNNLGILLSGAGQDGGDITLSAPGGITTGYIYSGSFDSDGDGTGGDISLTSTEGSIDTKAGVNNELIARVEQNDTEIDSEPTNIAERLLFELSDDAKNNEDFELEDTILAGISSFSIGDAGAINLTTISPTENILTSNINAESIDGSGGDINITTQRFFRAVDTFTSINRSTNRSISNFSVVGDDGEGVEVENGVITITHGGGGETPFIVGNASVNGTAGSISSRGVTISPDSFLFTERQGNVSIISIDGPSRNEDDPGNFMIEQPEQLQSDSAASANVSESLPIASIPEAQKTLMKIAQQAAQKPALVYVGFTASQINTTDQTADSYFINAENCRTAEYENSLDLDTNNANPTLCILPKPSDRLELLVITDEGKPLYVPVDVTREEVEKVAQRLYREVSRPGGRYYKAPAKKMYEWLIGNIEDELVKREIDNLLFIMPPKLRSLPIAALYDAKTDQFLAQKKYNVGFAPSLNLMDTRYTNIQKAPVLAFGASDFEEDENQQALPAVEIELPTINKLRGGRSIFNENFTFENLQANLSNQRPPIVHLSTHADFNPQDLDNIYIQLYDRKLSLKELDELGLNDPVVDLLVISACRSAFGDNQAELGFGGLAVKAGVKTAIGSLWYVGDTSTSALMSEFYHQLKTAPIKAEALKEAQVAMIEGQVKNLTNEITTTWGSIPLPENLASESNEDTDWSHPYYWAPFTIIGSPW